MAALRSAIVARLQSRPKPTILAIFKEKDNLINAVDTTFANTPTTPRILNEASHEFLRETLFPFI